MNKETLRAAGISKTAYEALINTQGQELADQTVELIASKKGTGTKSSFMADTIKILQDDLKDSEGTKSKYKVLDESKAIEVQETEQDVLAKIKSLLGTYRVNRMLFSDQKRHKKTYTFFLAFADKVDELRQEVESAVETE